MADEGQVIRGVNWRSTFPFINIFRSFRVAIHPSKLILGLALLVTVYVGGSILDKLWPIRARAIPTETDQDGTVVPGELDTYRAISNSSGSMSEWREKRLEAIDKEYAEVLLNSGVDAPKKDAADKVKAEADAEAQAKDDARARNKIDEVEAKIDSELKDNIKKANDAYKTALDKANDDFKASDAKDKAKVLEDDRTRADKAHVAAIKDAYAEATAKDTRVESYRGEGIFSAFFGYELNQVNKVVEAVKRSDWLVDHGVLDSATHFFTVGPVWLIWNHTVFAILFGLLFLCAWSLFGGGIARIAAVHVARDEKISVRQAMNFAVGKFLSFASAPVIPMLIVVVIGLVLAAASLLGNIPFLGPIIVGLFFFLALLAGFVMTLVLLGTAGGFNLMYPTIAVEGSDSFDAISRSFSYVYARPWRMLFYTAVAVAYGAATYWFVHLFIWTMLSLSHHFVGMGIFTHAENFQDSLNAMWPAPDSAQRLTYSVDYRPLNSGQATGAFLINLWVLLLSSFLGAFAISLYFSANSIIYYLMRAEVDATEMDDVYLEQSDEDFTDTTPAPAPSAPAASGDSTTT